MRFCFASSLRFFFVFCFGGVFWVIFFIFYWKKFICKEKWRGTFRKKSLHGSVEGKLHSVLGKWKYRRMRSEDEGACRSCLLLLQTTDELNRACPINKALLAPSPVPSFTVSPVAVTQNWVVATETLWPWRKHGSCCAAMRNRIAVGVGASHIGHLQGLCAGVQGRACKSAAAGTLLMTEERQKLSLSPRCKCCRGRSLQREQTPAYPPFLLWMDIWLVAKFFPLFWDHCHPESFTPNLLSPHMQWWVSLQWRWEEPPGHVVCTQSAFLGHIKLPLKPGNCESCAPLQPPHRQGERWAEVKIVDSGTRTQTVSPWLCNCLAVWPHKPT